MDTLFTIFCNVILRLLSPFWHHKNEIVCIVHKGLPLLENILYHCLFEKKLFFCSLDLDFLVL